MAFNYPNIPRLRFDEYVMYMYQHCSRNFNESHPAKGLHPWCVRERGRDGPRFGYRSLDICRRK